MREFSWISSMISKVSRLSRSILLQKVRIGRSRSRQTSKSLRVWLSTPLAPSITMIGGVHRGQRAVGVLGEVRVAGRVDEVEPEVAEVEGHRRGGDRDAALLLHLHEVRAGAPRLALGADLAGHLDRAAEEQELLGQRGLAGVGVRDDREGAAAGDLGRQGGGVGSELGHGRPYSRPDAPGERPRGQGVVRIRRTGSPRR